LEQNNAFQNGGGLKRDDFESDDTKAAFEKAASNAPQKRFLLLD